MSVLVGSGTNGKLKVTTGGELSSGNLNIGYGGGNGEVNVINGGKVFLSSSSLANGLIVGFRGVDTKGILNISGSGSMITADSTVGKFAVGNEGAEGYLSITDGGKLIINQGLWIGSRGGIQQKDWYMFKERIVKSLQMIGLSWVLGIMV